MSQMNSQLESNVTLLCDYLTMASNEEFFAAQKPAAVLKHGLLMRYAIYFAGKAGSKTGKAVAFVDGYAGPGTYDDGNPASPLLFLAAAEHLQQIDRHTQCVFVEADSKHVSALRDQVGGAIGVTIIGDTFENAVDQVLSKVQNHASLIFVDPFSLGVGADQLVGLLSQSTTRQPIDVIYHFSDHAVARIAERVVQADPDEDVQQLADRIDALLEETDWRREFEEKGEEERSYAVAARLARSFATQVAASAGAHSVTIDVRQRPSHLPIYSLCLFTKYEQAIWDFIDIAGNAYLDWIERCENDVRKDHMAAIEKTGQTALFEEPEVDRPTIEAALTEHVVPYLVDHIPKVLAAGPLRFVENPELVLGDVHGMARTTHVRTAVKSLYKQGVIDSDGKGDFFMTAIALVASASDPTAPR